VTVRAPVGRPLAARRGITRATYDVYTASLTPDLRIMDLLDGQPEFTKSFWDYLDLLVNDTRIEQGRAILSGYESDRLVSKPTMVEAARTAVEMAEARS